jgi:hypothetical protein
MNERTAFKILLDHDGILLSITTRSRAYFFFFSSRLVGMRTAPTTDPFPGIVEFCDYNIGKIVANWEKLANLKLPRKNKELR